MRKINKRLLRKDEIQGTAKKTWSKNKAKGIPLRSFVKISGRSNMVLQYTIQPNKRPLKRLGVYPIFQPTINLLERLRVVFLHVHS